MRDSGAQVGVATFAVNYLIEEGLTKSHASRMFSYCQMVFTAGRYASISSSAQISSID